MTGSIHGLSFPQHVRPDFSRALTQDTAGREIGRQRPPQLLAPQPAGPVQRLGVEEVLRGTKDNRAPS